MEDALGLFNMKFKCTNKNHYYGHEVVIGKVYTAKGSRRANDGACTESDVDRIYVDGWWVGIKNFEPVDTIVGGDAWSTP